MHDKMMRLIHPQADWHTIELKAAALAQELVPATADLLICDHLSGYVPDMPALLAKWVGVLKPGGWLAVRDTVVPGSRLRGKKANLQRRAGAYVNVLLRMVAGGNGRYLSADEWLDALRVVNISSIKYETNRREIGFNEWIQSANLTPLAQTRLRAMLKQTPEPVTAALTPTWANDRITLFFTDIVLVGRLEAY